MCLTVPGEREMEGEWKETRGVFYRVHSVSLCGWLIKILGECESLLRSRNGVYLE